ncbi:MULTISPECIES: recombination protein F [Qipengyuania]|uniref:Recombination protein F n=1 Tax=Qipengyuania nanhaisediminis TaxID=604088 RepID=A0A1I5NS32_9SPHN|nr:MULTISPECIES: recombination protein F [Qipengyuania]MBX7514737.1 recombination protein F [Qipengyuania intermedia]MCA0902699.1 recombination protein F [Qipengyuania aquimaris]SFP24583.1 hypothetical protein SAMN04488060_2055 [Qipengyuania nanhaisediminis]
MFDNENIGSRVMAAAVSVMISAGFFATAIAYATPTGMIA